MQDANLLEPQLRNCDFEIKEQDRFLPIANVTRVMKKALPTQAKLSKESKECVQECASEFILFVTSQAIDRCTLEKRKTLNGEDILWAMFTLGFEHYAETLKIYLAKYRQAEQEEQSMRAALRRRTKYRGAAQDDELEVNSDEYDFDPEGEYAGFDEFELEEGIAGESFGVASEEDM